MISITQLEYILALHRFGHFGKASAHCAVSQPSLSLQLQKAEEFLGYPLFDREKKPVEPTPKGLLFVAQASVVLSEHQRLMSQSQQENGVIRGNFELGVIPTIMPFLLPLIIKDFSKRFPLVNLNVQELNTELCISGIRHHSLDGAILATPLREKGIKERVLFFESFFLYANKDSKILGKKQIQVSDIDAADLWLLMDGHCFRNQVLNFCSIDGAQNSLRNIKLLGGSLEVLRQVVTSSWGYTLIPEMMKNSLPKAEQQEQVRTFAKSNPVREVSLVFAREQWKSDILEAIASCVQRCLPNAISQSAPAKANILEIV